MARRSVTIKDIAERIGVSYSSVSRALSGKPGVRDDVREKAAAEARRLGYFPNELARGLVMRRTHSIGLVIPDITNPFSPEVARGVANRASEAGYTIILCDSNYSRLREEQHCRMLLEKRVDGIVIAPVSRSIDAKLEKYPMPVVYINRVPSIPRSHVVIDHVRGGLVATRHLLDAGYGRVAYLGGNITEYADEERLLGYRKAFEEYGRSVDESLVLSVRDASGSLAEIPPGVLSGDVRFDAVFCANDVIALNVLQLARQMGVDVPRSLGIVGFDDIPFAAYPGVNLSTISQPKYRTGYEAADLCLAEIGRKSGAPRAVTLECRLEVRETSRGPGVPAVVPAGIDPAGVMP